MYFPANVNFLYSPLTKLVYDDTEKVVGSSTYELPVSSQPGYGFLQPVSVLNPIEYPTRQTADAVLAWAKATYPVSTGLTFELSSLNSAAVNQLAYTLLVSGRGKTEIFSAGQLAFAKDKNGEAATKASFDAALKMAGLL